MAHRIEVMTKPELPDPAGNSTRRRILNDLGIAVSDARIADVYTIDANLAAEQLTLLASQLFADPVSQQWRVDEPFPGQWVLEVGFRPGVADNVGKTAEEAINDMIGVRAGVYTSKKYCIRGSISRAEIEIIASKLLANDLIERWDINAGQPYVPKVVLAEPKAMTVDLSGDLGAISRERLLALSTTEMESIRQHFGDPAVRRKREEVRLGNITDVELEAIAQTWSEHCKHKIFNARIEYEESGHKETVNSLFDTYIRASTSAIRKPWLRSVFTDNAGIIAFNEKWNIAAKVETHNAPSALDPYGGALTGIVGVNRDVIGAGKGARLVFNTDVFCFATPFYAEKLPNGILHPKRIFEGVRRGVEHGGNKLGIPTINGSIVFDNRYLGRPLVYCGTCGIMPAHINGKPSHEKRIEPGDRMVMTGGRIGKDGIHGATFSSAELSEHSPASAVQLGDPITQKNMHDFLLEARDRGLYEFITDIGGGGLSSAAGESARFTNGCVIDLEQCPLKYPGLAPWEILLSESQERMLLALHPEHEKAFMELARRRGVEATIVGTFTDSGFFHVRHRGETVAYLDMQFMHHGTPQLQLSAAWKQKHHAEPAIPDVHHAATLHALLSRLNICSKEYVIRQYDHEVQGGSVVKPLVGKCNDGPSDAAVVRPLLDSFEGIVVSHGICPKYGDIDAYHMAACALDEAIRNAVAAGADPEYLAALDNFCWPDPLSDPYTLAQLVRANKALHEYTRAFGVPCISGKDSMKNDFRGERTISIPPTLLFTVVGKMHDVRKAVTMDAKHDGDLVYVLGMTRDEMGGSEYFALHNAVGNSVPKVDAAAAKRLYDSLHRAMGTSLVASCHDCSDGGLAVALAETAFAGDFGMRIDLDKVPYEGKQRTDYILFSESQSRFIVSIKPEHTEQFEAVMKGNVFAQIGTVTAEKKFIMFGKNGTVIDADIAVLKEHWQQPLRW